MKLLGRIVLSGTMLSSLAAQAQTYQTYQAVQPKEEIGFFEEMFTTKKKVLPRPSENYVNFSEAMLEEKPWIKDFKFVVVVNKAEEGADSQSIRIYKNGTLITLGEVQSYLSNFNRYESDPKIANERAYRISELNGLTAQGQDTVFKVSTGRNAFEIKGMNHSQKDNWTVTPSGFFTLQTLSAKHKSEAYSRSFCDSFAAKALGSVLNKEMCTMMEYAMFFNGGIALHKAIPGTEPKLGSKASGGCVRLPAALAEYLFRVFNSEKGYKAMPVVNKDGTVKTDINGEIIYSADTTSVWGTTKAWSTLVIVQNQVR